MASPSKLVQSLASNGLLISGVVGHLLVTLVLVSLVWSQLKGWVYAGRPAGDFLQFVHYTIYTRHHPGLPITSWNHLWTKGAPRTLDTTWLHFYLIQPLADQIGVEKAVWLYPVIALGGLVVASYFLFYQTSGSRLIGLALAIPVAISPSLHVALTERGVVTSAISQLFLPLELYFLVKFYQKNNYKHLVLAGVMAALGIYSHGLTMAFFGLLPGGLFLLFATKSKSKLISRSSFRNAALFSLVALTVGALAFWPTFLHSTFTGGNQSAMFRQFPQTGKAYPTIWADIYSTTSPKLWWLLGLGLIVTLVWKLTEKKPPTNVIVKFLNWLLKRSPPEESMKVTPFLVLAIFVFLWWTSYFFGLNRYEWFFFPQRIYWVVTVIGGLLAAYLFRPLTFHRPFNHQSSAISWLVKTCLKLAIFVLISASVWSRLSGFNLHQTINQLKTWQPPDFKADMLAKWGGLVAQVTDLTDLNHRLWARDEGFNQRWSLISDLPLFYGFFHFGTRQTELWDGWTYEVLSNRSFVAQDIPPQLTQAQSEFFLDWYGIKTLYGCLNTNDYCSLRNDFYQLDQPLVDKQVTSSELAAGAVTIKDEFTSSVVEAVAVPIVGFIGSDSGYRNFMLNLATLKLGSSKLVVLRLGQTVSALNSKTLSFLDGVVINEQRRQGWFETSAWQGLESFVKKGGRVWIDTGGNSVQRNSQRLPAIFPVSAVTYGSLGRQWQLSGELASAINSVKLSPLQYEKDPWQLSYAHTDQLRTGATVLLTQAGQPIVVGMSVGSGQVIWSGVNWFYRLEEYRDNALNEVIPVKLLFEKLLGQLEKHPVPSRFTFINPGTTEISTVEAKGILYKYNRWPGWVAQTQLNGQPTSLPIYTAGPELMFVSIPEKFKSQELTITFKYRGSPIDWISFGLTIIANLTVLTYLIGGERIVAALTALTTRPLKNQPSRHHRHNGVRGRWNLRGWWENEET